MFETWLLLPTATKIIDILLILSSFSFILFAIETFIKRVKPKKGSYSKDKGLTLEFEGNDSNSKETASNNNPLPPPYTIELYKEDSIAEEERKLSLQACIEETPSFGNELLLVVSKSIRFGYEISQTKNVTLIRAQMNMAQVKSDTILNTFLREYAYTLMGLQGKEGDNKALSDFSYEIFKEFMQKIVQSQILDDLKQSFKENHLASYSELTFADVYCKDHIDRILSNLRLAITNLLPTNINPSIACVLNTLNAHESSFAETLQEVFIDARSLAIKYETELKRKTEEFDSEILNLTGIKNASKSSK